jgi:ABC-type transport system involved in multi-copper enzyme maturation permease subunit
MITFPRIVRAEWTKLAALRSTWIVLATVIVLTAGIAGATGHHAREARLGDAFLGVDVFSLLLGVFGILMITGEYGSGLIRATFTAIPHRTPVLAAKAVVLLLISLPVMAVASASALLADRVFAGTPFHDPDVLRATIGAAAAPIGLALLGLGLGALVRHTAAAITLYVLSMLVLPALLQAALPDRLGQNVVRYVPVAAAQGMYAVNNPFRMLAPTPAALVLLAWVAAALAAGGLMLWRRDP